jgi:hypothetical protein
MLPKVGKVTLAPAPRNNSREIRVGLRTPKSEIEPVPVELKGVTTSAISSQVRVLWGRAKTLLNLQRANRETDGGTLHRGIAVIIPHQS